MSNNDVQKLVDALMQEGVLEKERLIKEGRAEKERLIKEGLAAGQAEKERLVQDGRREIEKTRQLMLTEIQQHIRDLLPAEVQALEANLQEGVSILVKQAFQMSLKESQAFIQLLDTILAGVNGTGIIPLTKALSDTPIEKRGEDILKLEQYVKSVEKKIDALANICRTDHEALSFIKMLMISSTLELARSQGTAYVAISPETAQALAGTLLAFKRAVGQNHLKVFFNTSNIKEAGFSISPTEDGESGIVKVNPLTCQEVISQWLSEGLRLVFVQAIAKQEQK